MEGLNEMPINWELLLEKENPEDALIMLKNELGPSILGIMEKLIHHLEQRRFFVLRSTIIRLLDYFSAYEAGPCIECLVHIKEDFLLFEGIDQNTLKSMIAGIQNLFLCMTQLLQYLQESLQIYSSVQDEHELNQKLNTLNKQLIKIQKTEQIQQYSTTNWKDAIIF